MILVQALGAATLSLLRYVGGVVFLVLDALKSLVAARVRWRLVMRQMYEIGFGSQLVVIVTGAFTGAVFTAQTYFQFHALGMDSAVGSVVAVSMCRELGPVLSGLMVAGRAGAAMSAEIGTMKVTEQVDALRALAVYPVDYLVTPRMLAMAVSMPLLVAESIAFGIGLSYYVGVHLLEIPGSYYWNNMMKFTELEDVNMGLIKAFMFGLIIVFVSCYEGLNTREGAVGVGRATTQAVVNSSLAILIVNFFLTMTLNIFFPAGT